uniref:Tectonin beta-propeller repeat-containing protein n=1 Tax=Daphnia magna TaxID=35525 RepID=A0A0P6H8Z5_9CRUS
MVMSIVKENSGSIYVVTTEGKIIQLLNGSWSELADECNKELRVKRISCCSTSLWAICGDHQVHMRLESELPIRIREESYENQRWNPIDGFSNKLLPTDRPFYSSQDGLTDRDLKRVKLPSQAWVWDEQWHLELLHEGQHLDAEGWMYAVDFPRAYSNTKAWNSCVRRRKWVRNRRYNGLRTWVSLPPVVLNDMMEPFIDIATGGAEIPGAVSGFVAVWAVTINGLLLYREGVNLLTCPDGTNWKQIETPQGCEPCQVSVGPQGVVWILAWTGQLLTRNGVTWNCETGITWYEVPPPFKGLSFSHISVGLNSTWAVSRENEVWLRKGLDSSILGSSWTAMVGQMNLVFTGSGSQVCGLSIQDQKIYLRTGIKTEESGGRSWKMLKTDDMTFVWLASDGKGCIHRLEDGTDSYWTEPWRAEILQKLRERHSEWQDKFAEYSTAAEITDWIKNGRALLHNRWVNLGLRCCSQEPLLDVEDLRLLAVEITAVRRTGDLGLVVHHLQNSPIKLSFTSEEEVEDWAAHLTKVTRASRQCIGIFAQSVWALTDMGDPFVHESKVEPEAKDIPYQIEMTSNAGNQSSLFIRDTPDGFYRGCGIIISGAVPANANRFSVNLQCGPTIQTHEVFTAKRDVALHINPRFDSCPGSVEVVRNSYSNNLWDIEEKSGVFDLQPGNRFTISIHCQKQQYLVKINEVVFTFAYRLSPFSVSHLVVKGDVNLFSVTYSIPKTSIPSHALWTQLGGHFRHVEASSSGVVWALGQDGTCWIHTGYHGGGFFKGVFDGNSHGIHPVSDEGLVNLYENQRWNPVAGFSARGLPTDRPPWSDITGFHTYSKENMSLPNRSWKWVSEWLVDYQPPGGADREGWQYATDYPSRYHAHKGSFDYVRRKRWQRKCRYTSTGPWFQFGLTKLLDVSMQVDHSGSPEEPLLLWAIATNGSILRRVGVTVIKPQGDSWEAVLGEHAFQSLSIGVEGRVWAITSLGAPALRHRVTNTNPDGVAWLLMDRPEGSATLRQISAGDTQVWAVDSQDRLYRRKDIVPILPEGTSWELVDEHVLHVSVGRHDQVWAVLDTKVNETKVKEKGSICIRRGITASCPVGTGWEFVIGVRLSQTKNTNNPLGLCKIMIVFSCNSL